MLTKQKKEFHEEQAELKAAYDAHVIQAARLQAQQLSEVEQTAEQFATKLSLVEQSTSLHLDLAQKKIGSLDQELQAERVHVVQVKNVAEQLYEEGWQQSSQLQGASLQSQALAELQNTASMTPPRSLVRFCQMRIRGRPLSCLSSTPS